jgi:hypothetical protein
MSDVLTTSDCILERVPRIKMTEKERIDKLSPIKLGAGAEMV